MGVGRRKAIYAFALACPADVCFPWKWWACFHQAPSGSNRHHDTRKQLTLCVYIRNQTSDKCRWHRIFHGLLPQGNHFVMLIHNSRHLFQQQSHQEQSADWVAEGILKSLPVLWEGNWTCTLVQPVLLFTWGCSHGTQCHIQGAEFASFHWCTSKSGRHIWWLVLCSDCHTEPPGHTDWYLNTLTVCLWGPMMKRHGLCFLFLFFLFKSPDLPSTAWNHVWCKGQFKGRALWGAYAVLPPRSELPAPSICSSTGLSIMMSFNRVREENCVALFTKEPKVLVFLNLPLVWATTLLPRVVREYVRGPIQKNPINGSCTELLALTLLSKF